MIGYFTVADVCAYICIFMITTTRNILLLEKNYNLYAMFAYEYASYCMF